PLECKFQKASLPALQRSATPLVGLAASDLDGDRDLDFLVLGERAEPAVVLNDRLLQFRRAVLPDKLLPAASWNGALVLDGHSDLLLLAANERPRLLHNRARPDQPSVAEWFEAMATNSPPLRQAVAVDLDLDSWMDVVGLSRKGLPVLLHNEGGRLVVRPEALGRDDDWPRDLIAVSVCAADGDGRPHLF